MPIQDHTAGVSVGGRTIVVVAHDFGRQRSATTARYQALAACAGRKGWSVRILAEAGLCAPDAALVPLGGSLENKRPLVVRAVADLLRGFRLGFLVPREGIAVVAVPAYFTGLVVATILQVRRRPYHLDVRDSYPDALVASGVLAPHSLLTRILDRWTRWVFRGAEGITAAGAGLARQIEARVEGACPVLVIRNGFGRRFVPAMRPSAHTPLIATHGTMGRFQNSALLAEVVLEARRQGLGWQFLVIGDGPTAHDLERANGTDLTRTLAVGQDDLPAHLAPAWVGISLRTDDEISADSIPVRMLEYLGLGIPVLVHPRSEGGEAVEREGFGEVVGPADAVAVVERLKEMMSAEAQARFRARVLARRDRYSAEAQWEPFFAAR